MRRRKVKVSTLLVVGEGPHDKAFINHMKGVFDSREILVASDKEQIQNLIRIISND